MTDRLTPPQLWDLAAIYEDFAAGPIASFVAHLGEEAARREAEAKELGRTAPNGSAAQAPIVEREGPGSADAPFWNGCFWQHKGGGMAVPDITKPASAADDLARRLRAEASMRARGGIMPERLLEGMAADRIEAQAREIADLTQKNAELSMILHDETDGITGSMRAQEVEALKARVARLTDHVRAIADDPHHTDEVRRNARAVLAEAPDAG